MGTVKIQVLLQADQHSGYSGPARPQLHPPRHQGGLWPGQCREIATVRPETVARYEQGRRLRCTQQGGHDEEEAQSGSQKRTADYLMDGQDSVGRCLVQFILVFSVSRVKL